jgi:hypothetical protein
MKTEAPLANATVMPQQAAPVAPNVPVAAELPPPFPQLQSGEIPAVLVPPITETLMQNPAINSIIGIFGQLPDMGLETYEAQDLSTVIYNPQSIDEAALQEAEANGTLEQLAMPLPGSEETPAEAAAGPAAGPLAGAQVSAPSNVNQSRLTSARTQNISPRQVSPVQPNPVTSQLARRAM